MLWNKIRSGLVVSLACVLAVGAVSLFPAAGQDPPGKAEPKGAKAADPADKPGKGAVRVGPNVHVSGVRADTRHMEVVLAADPADGKRLIAASMYTPPGGDRPAVVVYASADGGVKWARTLDQDGAGRENVGDPTLAVGLRGEVYLGYMRAPSLDFAKEMRLEVVRSADGGKTWGRPAGVAEYHDRPFLAVDRTGGRYDGRLYCQTHQGILTAADGGGLGPLRPLAARSGYRTYSAANPVVLSDGTLVVLSPRLRERGRNEEPTVEQPGYLAARRSADGGATFTDEQAVADFTNGRYSNVPSVAADAGPASPHKDRVYAVWVDHPPGKGCRVMFASSRDSGRTFPEPVVVSEPSAEGKGHDAFLPCVAVNKDGVVGVSWYDTRDLGPKEAGWDVRFRASADGGQTWTPSARVTDYSGPGGARRKAGAWGPGHTAGLAAGTAGTFHLLWIDARTGVEQVWTAAVEVALK